MSAEAKDVEELVGTATQTSALALSDLREGDIDRVAAFAMALRRSAGGIAVADDRALSRRVDAQLASALWRAAYGQDEASERMAKGALELALTLRLHTRLLHPLAAEPFRTRPLAARVIREWVHDRCGACGGSGSQEVLAGRRVRPTSFARNARLVSCAGCEGSGHARPNRRDRRHAIERINEQIDMATFDRLWNPIFRFAGYQCDRVAGNVRRPTMRALRGRS
ncbi:MAG: hypothetical protein WCS09_02870 [Pseudomonadota bacterium]